MKRFLFFFVAMTLAIGGTALGAEKETKLVVDGVEWSLKNPFGNRNGKMMVSVEDFTDIVDGTCKDLDENSLFLKAGTEESTEKPVWLDTTYECFILGKHTARNDVAGISPPRREFQKY